MISSFTPNWARQFTLEEFAKEFDQFIGDGWYNSGNTYALAYMRVGMVWVQVWSYDPRDAFKRLIELPHRTPEQTCVNIDRA